LITEQQNLLQSTFTADALLFDTISAFGTVGLTTNIMPALTAPGKLLMILCMFIGRCGPLTIALVVGVKEKRQLLRYPEEDVMIG
jgi:trk system potassium uptake protein TrkH